MSPLLSLPTTTPVSLLGLALGSTSVVEGLQARSEVDLADDRKKHGRGLPSSKFVAELGSFDVQWKKLNLRGRPNPNLDVAKGGAKAARQGKDKTKGKGDNGQGEA